MEGFIEGSIKDRSWLEVPDERKKENGGTYEQAPEDSPYAGEWFDTGGMIGIFGGGLKPWEAAEQQSEGGGHKAKPGFVDLFGEHPNPQDFPSGMAYRVARENYRARLRTFIGVGMPSFLNGKQIEDANTEFAAWGMGDPIHYQDENGWWSKFPDVNIGPEGYYKLPDGADVDGFGMAADTVVRFPHLVVATFQVYAVTQSRKVDPSIGIGEVLGGSQRHPLLSGVAV